MAYVWAGSGIDGAGFCNVAVQRGDGRVILGMDVGGLYWSSNHGDDLFAANAFAYTPQHTSVAGVAFSATVQDRAWACVGKKGVGGGLLRSDDNGHSWGFVTTTPQFSGSNNEAPLPVPHPRSTFVLKRCLDEANNFMYLPTYNQGVVRVNANGTSPTVVGLAGHYLRALMLDPTDPTHGFACSYGSGGGLSNPGLYECTNMRASSQTWTLVSGSGAPTTPEDIWLSDLGVLFVPSAQEGIKRYDGSWDTLVDDDSFWYSVDGYNNGGADTVFFGTFDPLKVGDSFQVLKRSDDNGDTLADIDQAGVNYTINDASGEVWWLSVDQENQMLGMNSSCVSCIDISDSDPTRIILAGRAGAWRSVDDWANWYPMVNGLGATIHRAPRFGPGQSGVVADGITDWTFISYDLDTELAVQNKPSPNTALDIAIDPISGEALLAVGDRDENTLGRVFSIAAPYTGVFTDTLLQGSQGAFVDLFQRTVTDGWGTADTGDAWDLPAGGEANFDVNGEAGTIVIGTNASRDAHQPDAALDTLGVMVVSFDAIATGGTHSATMKVRRNGTAFYGLRLRQLATNGNIDLSFLASGSLIGSTTVVLADAPANTKCNVKFLCQGTSPTTLKGKFWLDGEEEPETWTIEMTDSTAGVQISGVVGLRAQSATGYTGGATAFFYSVEIQNLSAVSGSDGKRPLGLANFRNATNQRVWLAAIEEYGIRRSVNGGAWADVDTTLAMQGPATSKYASFEYLGAGVVFLWDRDVGIFYSLDYGVTWALWWTVTSPIDGTGFLAHQGDRLYISDATQVRYVDNAASGTVT